MPQNRGRYYETIHWYTHAGSPEVAVDYLGRTEVCSRFSDYASQAVVEAIPLGHGARFIRGNRDEHKVTTKDEEVVFSHGTVSRDLSPYMPPDITDGESRRAWQTITADVQWLRPRMRLTPLSVFTHRKTHESDKRSGRTIDPPRPAISVQCWGYRMPPPYPVSRVRLVS